jgi:hypothetical protein
LTKQISLETAQRIAEVWSESSSALDAMHRAGLALTDVRNAYRYRRHAEEMLGIHLPSLHPERAGDWRVREGRDRPNAVFLDHPYTMVVFSDAHFWPGQTSPAFWVLLKIIEELQPDFVIDNGDSFDCASISRHPAGMWESKPTLRQELDSVIDHLEMVRDVAGEDCDFIRHIGNHDLRVESYLAQRAPDMADMPGTKLSDLFEEWDHQISTIFNETVIVKHRYRSGMHAAYNNVLHSGMSIVTGHTHKLGIRAHTDMRGTRYGIETGTLADPWGPQFRYVEQNTRDWRMGFVVLTLHGDRLHPELVEVHEDGTAWFRGKTYTAD